MQILHTGDVVRARGRSWRITDVRCFEGCRAISLAGIGPHAGASCTLLAPFDHLEPVPHESTTPRRAGTAQWRAAARALIGRCGVPGLLQAAGSANIDILPHQLEPAVAVLRGHGCRLLLADDVGLGKTIQACVLIVELRARAAAERVLVLTPAGLRDQWQDELARRFHVAAEIARAETVRRRSAELPPDVNPWTTWPVVIASMDYVKRPEVLRDVLNARWDLVVVDEAHRAAEDGERHRAAQALASCAAYVVLLTATPHSGDSAAFESLCRIGSRGERLLTFRRTRTTLASVVVRHIHRLPVRSTADEQRMRGRLEAFARAVRAERGDGNRDMWIALALLRKRAFSSARALHLSVVRRLDALAGIAPSPTQLFLPLDDEGELTSADEAPPWQSALVLSDITRERRLLTALADASAAAACRESKVSALRRLIRRVREPVIVFTEYRDTLAHLARAFHEPCVLLHGGLTRPERTAALETFAAGRSRILLATDAAAEGLNLHRACRLVVNLELPWNPMRLEQRIGRVDRIGQTRTVHVFHLMGADSGELRLLDDLRARIADAQAVVGAPDPLDGALGAADVAPLGSESADVEGERQRLCLMRTLQAGSPATARPLIARARNRRTRARLQARHLSLWEFAIEDGSQRQLTSRAVAVAAPGTVATAPLTEALGNWQREACETARRFGAVGLARADAIISALTNAGVPASQPGLFDRRAHFADAALRAARDTALSAQHERRAALQRSAELHPQPPRLRLVLEP